MAETNMKEVVKEIQSATEDELKELIEGWFDKTRTDGMKIGAKYISAAIFGVIQKHIKKKAGAKPSLRDYQRCIDGIKEIIAVQLTQQSDLEETEQDNVEEENANDGTAE